MSNFDIKHYLPDVKIVPYNELQKYGDIERLLPKNGSYFILLYQDSQNSGHWCCLCRYADCVEFFDSYGNPPDKQLKWVPEAMRESIGVDGNYLSRMLKGSRMPCIYNKVKYQADGADIATCGRHCVWRLLNFIKRDMTLKQYNQFMKKSGLPADLVVSELIDRTSE